MKLVFFIIFSSHLLAHSSEKIVGFKSFQSDFSKKLKASFCQNKSKFRICYPFDAKKCETEVLKIQSQCWRKIGYSRKSIQASKAIGYGFQVGACLGKNFAKEIQSS